MKRWVVLLALMAALALAGCNQIQEKETLEHPTVFLEMETGDMIRLELFPEYAPNTVANFVYLAQKGFYDGLTFHRVIAGYWIQGGDPLGDNTGGPGYRIEGEFAENGFRQNRIGFTRGVVAMARKVSDYNSAGSQFFIMLSPHSEFNGEYAAFGCIESSDSESLATLEALESALVDRSYRPVLRQTITSIRVDTKGYIYEVIKHGEQEEAQPAGSPNV
jgi:cyclophilin family peptidyl-prolyl cis-trans isomerase